ncbi:GntR family transcriptional regulator [Streptomyces smyrnaeus]|uniref:GntR family transcriptional regulator n=1 Tax=Streptomyces TaxID=1883 RepID=UPI000C18F3D9|nr:MULTISPECIES: GntR family transcriptional regulator [unclassified Streptomyces]MBQ0867675.1 GntR family transcriptional regulator [Streptomyces sp. RK75]MBQ1120489.1 GntR family transcriptional regulator [Streptomyces sp. B15]MBQ1160430.1 GntR family transcriptional regulator [Streptomyces sp. A73]
MTTPHPPVTAARGPQLKSVSLRQQAREALRTRIVLGQIEPGRVESVINVASELGVSVTPVREAVMDLANLGMVEIIRNRGFRVPVLTDHDLEEIFRLRTMLEVPAMVELAQLTDRAPLTRFRQLAEQLTDAARQGDLVSFLDLDRQFHLGLLELLGNRRLVEMVGQLRDQARMQGLQKLADHGELTQSGEEHIAIVDAVEADDGELTAELVRKHLTHSRGIWAGRTEGTA